MQVTEHGLYHYGCLPNVASIARFLAILRSDFKLNVIIMFTINLVSSHAIGQENITKLLKITARARHRSINLSRGIGG